MVKVKLEISFPPGPPQEVSELARQAEDLGYHRIGILDSPALFREPWVTLAVVAQATQNVPIGTHVTNPLTRHPVVTASAAMTLDDLAPGRVSIGIGSGDSGVYNLGFTGSPMSHLEEYVLTIKRLLEKGEAEYQGRRVLLSHEGRHIPIYMSAHGKRSIQLAGKIADGVIMGLGIRPEVIHGCLDLLKESAEEAGRDMRDIDVWWLSGMYVDPRPGEAMRKMAWSVSVQNHHLARFTLEGKFIPEEHREAIKKLGDAYDISVHARPPQEVRDYYDRYADELGIRDYLMDRFLMAGTPDEVEPKIRRATEAGATQFTVGGAAVDMETAKRCMQVVNTSFQG